MTRDHFNKPRRDHYVSHPNFTQSKEYEVEIKIEMFIHRVLRRVFSIPRRFWSGWQKRRASKASRILRKRRGRSKRD
jgi:hypothetical protein